MGIIWRMVIDQMYQFLPTAFKNVADSEMVMRMLRPQMRSHFREFVSPGDLVFDVGANVGALTQVYLDLGARVVCIEPQPYCLTKLHKRFDGNSRVTIVPKGVAHEEGRLPLFISSGAHTTSTFSKKVIHQSLLNNRNWDSSVEVPVTTLNALIQEYGTPDFCKIDIEGFEEQAFQALDFRLPALSFEFHREFLDEARRCVEYLQELGAALFNYSLFFNYSLQKSPWYTNEQLFRELAHRGKILNGYLRGDIYARLP